MTYRVTWEIDIEDVEAPLTAALEAHLIMLDLDSIATVFTVTCPDGSGQLIDLLPGVTGGLHRDDREPTSTLPSPRPDA